MRYQLVLYTLDRAELHRAATQPSLLAEIAQASGVRFAEETGVTDVNGDALWHALARVSTEIVHRERATLDPLEAASLAVAAALLVRRVATGRRLGGIEHELDQHALFGAELGELWSVERALRVGGESAPLVFCVTADKIDGLLASFSFSRELRETDDGSDMAARWIDRVIDLLAEGRWLGRDVTGVYTWSAERIEPDVAPARPPSPAPPPLPSTAPTSAKTPPATPPPPEDGADILIVEQPAVDRKEPASPPPGWDPGVDLPRLLAAPPRDPADDLESVRRRWSRFVEEGHAETLSTLGPLVERYALPRGNDAYETVAFATASWLALLAGQGAERAPLCRALRLLAVAELMGGSGRTATLAAFLAGDPRLATEALRNADRDEELAGGPPTAERRLLAACLGRALGVAKDEDAPTPPCADGAMASARDVMAAVMAALLARDEEMARRRFARLCEIEAHERRAEWRRAAFSLEPTFLVLVARALGLDLLEALPPGPSRGVLLETLL